MDRITRYINEAVFSIFGIIDVLLILRFALKLIAARTESSFVLLVYKATDGFVSSFNETLSSINVGQLSLEIDTLVAIFVYIVIGLGLYKILEAIFEKKAHYKIRLALDTLFKIAEVILSMRLFFKLVGAGESRFIQILYFASDVFFKPFEGLLPSVEADKYVFETATLIAIIIVIILDMATENLFNGLKNRKPENTDVPDNFVRTKENTFTQMKPEQNQATNLIQPVQTQRVEPTILPQPVVRIAKGTIATILGNKNGQSAVIEIDNLLSPIFYKNPNLLTRAEKNIVLIEELEREVNNGGFSQFFNNSAGGFANETLSALASIGSVVFSKLLKEAISVFPNEIVPKLNDIRRNSIVNIENYANPVWSKLDTEFYKYDENIYQLMIDYIKANIGDFR